MAKNKHTNYVCKECGADHARWMGKCGTCGAWNSLIEKVERNEVQAKNRFSGIAPAQEVTNLSDVEDVEFVRTSTGSEELDRVLGGGLVDGTVCLIGADPGFGKSTLLAQAADYISKSKKVLYISGEESASQVAMRSRRIGLDGKNVRFYGEIALSKVIAKIEDEDPAFCVVDSIQTLYHEELTSSPGSVTQVKECASHITRVAKARGMSVVLIGHVTKTGDVAGPQVLAHMVDVVLAGEGDTGSPYRLVRATKNRYGATELGVFAMTENGMRGVSNPSALFMSNHKRPVAGSCIVATIEGTRPMLVELQSLVSDGGPSPRRLSVGLERERLAMLLAVLAKHANISTAMQDVYVSATGGMQISEAASDLAMLMAINSSMTGRPLPKGFFSFGEVGLVGEVRPAPRGQDRLKECARLGLCVGIIPRANMPKKQIEGLELHAVDRVEEALEVLQQLR